MTTFNVEEVRFWCRRDTAANWTSVNPILASGEWGIETNNTGATVRKYKIGDGITAWTSLPYAGVIADGDKGDIVVSSSGAVWTVENDAISNAKLANMVASTVKARKTGSTGDPEDCTLSEVLDLIGSVAQGDILYRGASGWARLGAGTSGHFLKTQGTGANPVWDVASGGGSTPSGSIIGGAYVTSTTARSTTNTTIPTDNTIPQNTEGQAYTDLDLAYTPTSATSTLEYELDIPIISHSTGGNSLRFAAFEVGGSANALFATLSPSSSVIGPIHMRARFRVPASSTSARTVTWRIGVGSGTGYINSSGGTQYFGSSNTAIFSVKEIKA